MTDNGSLTWPLFGRGVESPGAVAMAFRRTVISNFARAELELPRVQLAFRDSQLIPANAPERLLDRCNPARRFGRPLCSNTQRRISLGC
jgi:hypothetical protein